MSEILLSAVFSCFFVVRLAKGPWLRNPQYLAVAITGSILGTLLLHNFAAEYDGDLIIGSIASLGGAWGGILLFDTLVGLA
jgi:hypothetical protein